MFSKAEFSIRSFFISNKALLDTGKGAGTEAVLESTVLNSAGKGVKPGDIIGVIKGIGFWVRAGDRPGGRPGGGPGARPGGRPGGLEPSWNGETRVCAEALERRRESRARPF